MPAARLGEIFDCSERHIFSLAKRGIIVRHAAGRGFDARQSVRRYIVHLRIAAAARTGRCDFVPLDGDAMLEGRGE